MLFHGELFKGKLYIQKYGLLLLEDAPVFLPGKFHEQRSLVGYSPWSCKELDAIEHTHKRDS